MGAVCGQALQRAFKGNKTFSLLVGGIGRLLLDRKRQSKVAGTREG